MTIQNQEKPNHSSNRYRFALSATDAATGGTNNVSSRASNSKSQKSQLLTQLNNNFLLHHHKAAKSISKHVKNAIIYQGQKLSVWQNKDGNWQKLASHEVEDQQYHDIKAMAHIPVSIYLMLTTEGDPAGSDKQSIHKLLDYLQTLKAIMKSGDIYEDRLGERLITLCSDHLLRCLRDPLTPPNALLMNREVCGIQNTLIQLAAEKTIHQIDLALTQFEETYHLDLLTSRILIAAPHGPAKNLAELQYFQKRYMDLIGTAATDDIMDQYIYLTEVMPKTLGSPTIEEDLIEELLERSEVNLMIGDTVLHDEKAMFSDVLGDAAKNCLFRAK